MQTASMSVTLACIFTLTNTFTVAAGGKGPIVPPDAKLEKIFDKGMVLTEGVAVAPDGMVYFSDITFSSFAREKGLPVEAGHIWKFDPKTLQDHDFPLPQRHVQRPQVRRGGQHDRRGGSGFRRPAAVQDRHEDRQELHSRGPVRGPALQFAQRHRHR